MANKKDYKKCILDRSGVHMAENFMDVPRLSMWGDKLEPGHLFLTDKQKEILRCFETYGNVAVVKTRGCGFTSLLKMRAAYRIVTSDGNERFMVFTSEKTSGKMFVDDVADIVSGIDKGLWTEEPDRGETMVARSGNRLVFSNGCSLMAIGSPEDLKGIDFNRVSEIYMDEWLFASNAKTMYETLKSYIGKGTRFIMGSSPNNSESLGYDTLEKLSRDTDINFNCKIIHMGPKDKIYNSRKIDSVLPFMSEAEKDEYYGIVAKRVVFEGIDYGKGADYGSIDGWGGKYAE